MTQVKKALVYVGEGIVLISIALLLQVGFNAMSQWKERAANALSNDDENMASNNINAYPIQPTNVFALPSPTPQQIPYPHPLEVNTTPAWNVLSPPTLIPNTPMPITYSLSSASSWKTYSNDLYGFSFRYPELFPSIYNYEVGGAEISEIVINIRTGPTTPANPQNRAIIEVLVYPNPKQLSVDAFCAEYGETLGWPINIKDLKRVSDESLPVYLNHLLEENASVVYVPMQETGQEYLIVSPSHQKYIYLLSQGYMTSSETQDKIFHLFVENFHTK